jgi:hypothetical protein
MATNELRVKLSCSCGRSIIATAKDAGTTLNCTCGGEVQVPRLSQLRTMAGGDAFVTNPVDAIRKAQRSGNDPAGNQCLLCGCSTPVLYPCRAVCEQSHVKHSADDPNYLLRWLFLPWFLNALMSLRPRYFDADRRGHDVEVSFTLPLCNTCANITGKATRPAVARQLMSRVPLYDELLKFYPQLTVVVDQPNAP